jgi:poly(3-hydroxybutyrate) depolymerase
MQLPQIGDLFEQRYAIVDLLGEGGFARVFRAQDTKLQRAVALKVIAPTGGEYTDVTSKRFLREAAVLAGLQDPHTITLFDFGQSADGLLYMAFEYVAGSDLSGALAAQGPLDPTACLHVLLQILSSLREAHRAGILHRDIKPANILMGDYGGDQYSVRLLDFGIAKARNENHSARLTATGRILGTPRYMSPEQLFGETLTPASDIYSLGLVAYEILSGRSPIVGSTPREIMEQQLAVTPWRIPQQLAPESVRRVLEKMLERDPTNRFQSADEATHALQQAARSLPRDEPSTFVDPRDDMETLRAIPAVPPAAELGIQTTEATGANDQERRSNIRALLAMVALVAVAGLLVMFVLSRDTDQQRVSIVAPTASSFALLKPEQAAPAVERQDVDEPPGAAARAVENGRLDGPRLSAGCSEPAPALGMLRLKRKPGIDIQSYITPAYDHSKPNALVVMLHAHWGASNTTVLRGSDYPTLGPQEGFVAVAMRKMPRSFESTQADVAAVERSIDWVTDRVCIDLSNILVIGEGTGGSTATAMRCSSTPPRAIATFAYRARGPLECDAHVPTLMIAGRKNRMIPIEGGNDCPMVMTEALPLREHINIWRELQHCTGEGRAIDLIPNAECETWSCRAPLINCVHDGGRKWPGEDAGVVQQCSGGSPPFDLAAELWKFLETHRLTYDDAP